MIQCIFHEIQQFYFTFKPAAYESPLSFHSRYILMEIDIRLSAHRAPKTILPHESIVRQVNPGDLVSNESGLMR